MPAAAVPTTPQSQRGIEDSTEKRTEEDRKYNGDSVAPDAACSSSENEPTGNEDSSSTNLGSGATTDCCAAARFVGGFASCFSHFAGTAAAAVGTAAFVGECFTHRSSLGHHPFADRHQFRSRVGPQPKDILRVLRTMCANPFHQRARGKRWLARQQKIQRATQTVEIGACGHLVAIDRLLTLDITSTARGVQLTNAANDVGTLGVSNPGRRVIFNDADDLSLAGIAADNTTLNVGGNLTQTSQIVGNSLTVAATAGSVTLTNAANSVAAATISNGNRAVSFVNALALTLGGLTMGTGSLTVGGALTQTGPISGSSLSITSSAGSIDLRYSANNLDSLSVSNGSRLFSYADSSSVAITSAGTLSVGTVTAAQQLTVTTTNGGNDDVGPQPNGLLQSGGTLDLRAVQGASIIRNGGRIVGNPILLPPGTRIQVGGAITTPAELNAAVSTLNSLPASPGPTYEIFVASNMTLTQQLAVSRPVIFRGASQSTVVSGSSGVTNGLLLDSGASGSVIRDIAFSSFSGDAIRLTSATGITIKGIQANNSGNGLSITGASTNTVVQGNTFDRNQTGVSLVSATGALIGGAATGQGNVISSAVRQGVFASGFCTGSQVVKNTSPGTATPYNVSASRNLTIVN